MIQSNLKTINSDLQTLVQDAQSLFNAAAALTGVKADEARERGMQLLDKAMLKANEVKASTVSVGKEIAASADSCVKESPWRAMAVVAGVGLLLGVALSRKF
jgi:ElaB/YqjD/DUF883 family membrane-anchored ribosome-binding protein